VKISAFFILFLISFSAFAGVLKVDIRFPEGKIKQGAIIPVKLVFDLPASQGLPLNKLVGETLGGTFYIFKAKPLLTKDNWTAFESDAEIIVAKVPENEPVTYKSGENEVMITWNDVEFIPTEAPKEMIYGTFEIPSRAKILLWLSILAGIIVIAVIGWKVKSHFAAKNVTKKRRVAIKDEVISAREYNDVVKIWQKKPQILKEFPVLETNFKNLESVLFKYQFKSSQSETEKIEVMNAYRDFVSKSLGGFDGV
jgi:hypothetical protein